MVIRHQYNGGPRDQHPILYITQYHGYTGIVITDIDGLVPKPQTLLYKMFIYKLQICGF